MRVSSEQKAAARESGGGFGLLGPGPLLRIEGAAGLALAIAVYAHQDESWVLFAALILVPDVAILLYFLVGPRAGTVIYNLFHTYLMPLALALIGIGLDNDLAVAIALIWLAHISADRMLGFGLKYPTSFQDTHLQRV
jgi:hypothetical protein